MHILNTRNSEIKRELDRINRIKSKAGIKKSFENYRSKINITNTFHSQKRSLERLQKNADECIEDILKHIKCTYQGIENKDICIVKGQLANYILSKEGICITILSKHHKYEGFSNKRFPQGRFFNISNEEGKVIFKRK